MIRTPFEARQKSNQDELPIPEISRNSDTSRKFLGSRGTDMLDHKSQTEGKKEKEARISLL
jgi:hypothetical protein